MMDEAFSALEPGTRRGVQQLIRKLWESAGTTILFVTHNTHEAVQLATRILVLAKPSPDKGSCVKLDLKIPERRLDEDLRHLVRRLEAESQTFEEEEELPRPAAKEI